MTMTTVRRLQRYVVVMMAWMTLMDLFAQQDNQAHAFSARDPPSATKHVLVTGAAGKTGRLVWKKLKEDERYEPKALVRTERSAKALVHDGYIHCPLEDVVVSDITSPTFLTDDAFLRGLHSIDAMIICTSAVPRISRRSLFGALLKAPINVLRRKKAIDFRSLRFCWKHDGYPEKVDYYGQLAQFQLAKKLNVKQVIVISSMGGTNPDNFLNRVGKNHDGTGNGDILLWKRKAEMALIESGLTYTIIHPGGLVDTPGGVEEFVLDVDDAIIGSYDKTRISREDVADLCVASLSVTQGQNVSFDCITLANDDSDGNDNYGTSSTTGMKKKQAFGISNNKKDSNLSTSTTATRTTATMTNKQTKTAEQALLSFMEQSKTANYAL